MKRLLVAFGLSLFLFVPAGFAAFSDVSGNDPHSAAINSLVEQEILEGYEDGTFKPEQQVTRAEAIKIILLGMGEEVNEASLGADEFSDVSADDWFYSYVGTAVDLGIVKGYEDGTFRPQQTVNRAEALKITLEAARVSADEPSEAPFVDVPLDAWFAAYAGYARTFNIEPPQSDGFWHPEGAITRANISEMVYREQFVLQDGVAFDESRNWARADFPTASISLKVPFGWYSKGEGVGAVWLQDSANGQLSLLFPYANGGTLLMTRYSNPNSDSPTVLFDNLSANLEGSFHETSVGGFSALIHENGSEFYKEWFVVIPDNSMVHFSAMRGDGPYGEFAGEFIEMIVASIEFVPSDGGVDVSAAVSAVRAAIQIDGVGQENMDLLADLELIDTDAIGVGTGPVDYFYSPSGDITIKYERSFDVILDVEDGRTTSF